MKIKYENFKITIKAWLIVKQLKRQELF